MKIIKIIFDNEDNMFELDKEYEGTVVNNNLNVVSKQIESYFKSPLCYDFSAVNKNDKEYGNEKNTDKNKGIIDNEYAEIEEYENKDEEK